MKKEQVPQDKSHTYGGQCKLLYATDEKGKYSSVKSNGWEVEEFATFSAIEEINRNRTDAWQRAKSGTTSPLEYYMYEQRMDLAILAQTTGFFQWRIKKHFKPAAFFHLNDKAMQRYAEALGLSIATLKTLPESP